MGLPCTGADIEIPDPLCPVGEWSDWSPCSVTCGKGVKIRTRLLLVEPSQKEKCHSRRLTETIDCMDAPDCTFDAQTAKGG